MRIRFMNPKEWKKLDNTIQQIILKRLNQVLIQIKAYNDFNKIFNNDRLIYKAYPNNFFIVKNNATFQVRLLCRYNKDKLEVHKIYIKNGKNKAIQNVYIKDFNEYVENYNRGVSHET